MKTIILYFLLCVSLLAQSVKVGGSGATKVGGSGVTKVTAVVAGGSVITFDAITPFAFATNANNPAKDHTQGNLTNGYVLVFIAAVDSVEGDIVSAGLTYDGAAATKIGNLTYLATNYYGIEVYGLALGSKVAGTYSAAISDGSGDAAFTVVGIMTLNNVHQTVSTGTVVTASGTSTGPSVDATSAAGELVVGGVTVGSSSATIDALGSGQTERVALTRAASGTVGLGASSEEGTATTTHSYTLSASVPWVTTAVPLKPN